MPEKSLDNYIEQIELCQSGKDAPCKSACPFQLNVRVFIEKIQRGNLSAAFNLYRNAVIFPDITRRLCPAPCKSACEDVLQGNPVNLPLLEWACMDNARSTEPINFNLPQKQGRIAIIGAGLSGLTCALKLAEKRYQVTLYEQSPYLGGSLINYLDRSIIESDIKKQFKFTICDFKMNTRISRISELDDDAVYLSSSAVVKGHGAHVFRCPTARKPTEAIVNGKAAADEIEWYLTTGSKKSAEADTKNPRGDIKSEVRCRSFLVQPENGISYTKDEAKREADRCTLCDCSVCLQSCLLLKKHGATPRDLAKEVGTSLNLFNETQSRAGMREIGSCTFCGLCKKICPANIDIGGLFLHAREGLSTLGVLPPAHHEFWLRDMAFSNAEDAAFFYRPQADKWTYMFFPGCQSGGSDPRYVSMTYQKLLTAHPDTAILVRCCGAPALWAGETEAFHQELLQMTAFWEKAGRPIVLLSCPSCYRIFSTYLRNIPIKTVYDMLEFSDSHPLPFEEAAIFDPCASGDFPQIQVTVRGMFEDSGIKLQELKNSGETARCCGWGGQAYAVNPDFVNALTAEQIAQSDLPYITYCTNCHDIFSSRGKNCRHLLDLVNDINNVQRVPPTVTERRENRRNLKRELAKEYGTSDLFEEERPRMKLKMTQLMTRKLSQSLILEEDISAVIDNCEKTGIFIRNLESGHCIGHLQLGIMTYWVDYKKNDDGTYTLFNAYSHRMTIKRDEAAQRPSPQRLIER